MTLEYYVPDHPASVKIAVGLCRFYGNAAEVEKEEEIRTFLEEMKKKYPGASHHCWAYRLGYDSKSTFRYSDDGEPSQTAGAPILTAIDHLKLTNTMVIVTRYYGGVKQGVGGLIRAYHAAAAGVLQEAGRKTVTILTEIRIPCRYDQIGWVTRELQAIQAVIVETEYQLEVLVRAKIRPVDLARFSARLFDLSGGSIRVIKAEEEAE
ncbi:MAG: YigZ family protein [Negativicutes bacterium]|nr:YigZ family protein [Negativicutes bacterium]